MYVLHHFGLSSFCTSVALSARASHANPQNHYGEGDEGNESHEGDEEEGGDEAPGYEGGGGGRSTREGHEGIKEEGGDEAPGHEGGGGTTREGLEQGPLWPLLLAVGLVLPTPRLRQASLRSLCFLREGHEGHDEEELRP